MPPIVAETISVENQIDQFFHSYSIGTLLRQCNIRKEKGIPMESLFQFLLALAFTGKNLFRHMEPSDSKCGIFKDVGYRLQMSSAMVIFQFEGWCRQAYFPPPSPNLFASLAYPLAMLIFQ